MGRQRVASQASAGQDSARSSRGVNFGDLGRTTPFSEKWGFDRGHPIDRYFIEKFLSRHSNDIAGHVLEIKDNTYTVRFGGPGIISDVLDISSDNTRATIVADLTDAVHVEGDRFDCIIITQTLQFIYDVKGAISTLHRLLKGGGVLLLTVPAISPDFLSEHEGRFYWAMFPAAVQSLLVEYFESKNLLVEGHGNMLTSIAFLSGLAQNDLYASDFTLHDPHFPLIVTARAVKSK